MGVLWTIETSYAEHETMNSEIRDQNRYAAIDAVTAQLKKSVKDCLTTTIGSPVPGAKVGNMRLFQIINSVFLQTVLMSNTLMATEPVDYLRDIKPILKERCVACHGALKQEAELRLDTAALILKGGDSGAAIQASNAERSLLIDRVSAEDESDRMPPEGESLSPQQVDLLKAWINQGAKSPEDEHPEADPTKHWAFQKPVRTVAPGVKDQQEVRNGIDPFIVARLERATLKPLPIAEKHVLLRRVYLDLIGVPPTRKELHAFLADKSPIAYEIVVDQLLNDSRYGERWARHWMDIWRYSDWYGRRHVPDVWNSAPQIWRWRDWIVNSLNQDHGYDRMLREMLAADEISPEDKEAGYATGYLIRNWYALNPNDWMRSTVEHTGKAFLGLTFNCAHCHDHKYDPIEQDDYFRLRAFFEPMYLRQDRVPGEADPGPFEDYNYGKLRKIQRLGAVRVFDKNPDAPTWFYTDGDERNRVKDRSSIRPGLPKFLAESLSQPQQIALSPRAWYPGLRPGIQNTVLAEAREAITMAESAVATARKADAKPTQAARDQLIKAEAAYEDAVRAAKETGSSSALAGNQSLFFDATTGRRVLHNRLPGLKSLEEGFTLEFQLQLLTDTHFNFQLIKHVSKGLTAGYVAFKKGRVVSYQPGSFSEFETGRYDFAAGQARFHVKLTLQTETDCCLLSVRSLSDDKLLVDDTPVALNGWNPIGDPTKAISFDARAGSIAAIDEVIMTAPVSDSSTSGSAAARVAYFDFEGPAYPDGRDVVGLGSWEASSYGVAPATSVISTTAVNPLLKDLQQHVDVARRAVNAPTLPLQTAKAQAVAARAELAAVEARIAADNARYGETPEVDVTELTRKASRLERTAAVRKAEANVLDQERLLVTAEGKPADDANRSKEVDAATKALASARMALDNARTALADETKADSYKPFSPVYPKTSTGRRRALAQWITSRENPLTARVAVNHIWMRHFHAPLVASVNDFGRNGDSPTHPLLLDWLAVELMDSGWSMKHLHRLIVSSKAYRRASAAKDASQQLQLDPENRFLWRMNAGRMEAEVVRDSLLHCGGMLEQKMGGQALENKESLTTHRRSLYYETYPEEGGKSPLGELFDGPDALECYRRTRTVVPQQALALTNSGLVHEVSAAIVIGWESRKDEERENSGSTKTEQFVVEMFERVLSRRPSDAELQVCVDAMQKHPELTAADSAEGATRARGSIVRALLNHNDFVTIR
ncbi:MAG: mono/diheme cytochrome c family protein [Planctomycetaceae bacterium]|jgi:mono/diheme cytochrome c family protein